MIPSKSAHVFGRMSLGRSRSPWCSTVTESFFQCMYTWERCYLWVSVPPLRRGGGYLSESILLQRSGWKWILQQFLQLLNLPHSNVACALLLSGCRSLDQIPDPPSPRSAATRLEFPQSQTDVALSYKQRKEDQYAAFSEHNNKLPRCRDTNKCCCLSLCETRRLRDSRLE